MEAKGFLIPLLVLAICAVEYTDCASHHSHIQAPAPAPAVDCMNLVMNMSDCLSFVSQGSTATKPEATCCTGLASVMEIGPQCLCVAFETSAKMGIQINATKAVTLPALCKLPSSEATDCGMSGTPTAAPANSPGSSQTGGGSTAGAPGSSSQKSGSSPLPFSAGAMAIGLVVVSFFSL